MTDDTISRQAAIKMFKGLPNTDNGFSDTYDKAQIISVLEALPSVQPEIIRCKDCKHGSPNGKYGCRVYHYRKYETHDMKPDDFCSHAERRTDE